MAAAKTNKRHRTFKAKTARKDPITFDLEGTDAEGTAFSEEFTARPEVSGALIIEFAKAAKEENGIGAFLDFFEVALVKDSYEGFSELIRDSDRFVDVETLTEVVGYLVEEYTSRPTSAS